MKKIVPKVFAYITFEQQLLIFRHRGISAAGIQVPAGTVETGEDPEHAVLREALEETGLTALKVHCFLGEQKRDMSDFGREEIHRRFFYYLEYSGRPIATWEHTELYPSGEEVLAPIVFEFFWVPFPHGVPQLIADHGIMLPLLENVLLEREGRNGASPLGVNVGTHRRCGARGWDEPIPYQSAWRAGPCRGGV